MNEGQIHEAFVVWLNKRGIPFRRDRMDKPTTTTTGEPDFLLTWCNRCIYIEVKTPKGALRPAQVKRIAFLRGAGNRVVIARSVAACVEAAESILCTGEKLLQEADTVPIMPFEPENIAGASPAKELGRYLGDFAGQLWVFESIPGPKEAARAIRAATSEDIVNLRRKSS